MKDHVIVDDYATDEKENVCWVSIVYVSDGHRLFQASFVPRIGGVNVAEQDSSVPEWVIALMSARAIEFFKEHKVFRPVPIQARAGTQEGLPL